MPPIREYFCDDCDHSFDFFELSGDTSLPQCTTCQSLKVYRKLSAPANYAIMGNNSASVRPSGIGKKDRGKK